MACGEEATESVHPGPGAAGAWELPGQHLRGPSEGVELELGRTCPPSPILWHDPNSSPRMHRPFPPICVGDLLGQSPKQTAEGSQQPVKERKFQQSALWVHRGTSGPVKGASPHSAPPLKPAHWCLFFFLFLDPEEGAPSILMSGFFFFFNTNRLRKFLETKTDVEISTQPALEDQTLDFADVEQLLGAINTIPRTQRLKLETLVARKTRKIWKLVFVPLTSCLCPYGF